MNDCECMQYGNRLKEVSIFIRSVLWVQDTLHFMYFGERDWLESIKSITQHLKSWRLSCQIVLFWEPEKWNSGGI